MSFSVSNNGSSATFYANLNQQKLENSLAKMASAKELNKSADDASAMAIANQLGAQVREASQSIMNANDSIGMIQIADSAVGSIQENMGSIKDLAMRATSPIMSAANKTSIQNEINALMESNQLAASSANYNGMSLLDGSENALGNVSSLLEGGIDLNSENVLENIQSITDNLGSMRSDFGASQNQLLADINNTSVYRVNTAAAESNMRDLDFAQESSNFSRQNIQAQVASFVQAQSNNIVAQNVTGLLQ